MLPLSWTTRIEGLSLRKSPTRNSSREGFCVWFESIRCLKLCCPENLGSCPESVRNQRGARVTFLRASHRKSGPEDHRVEKVGRRRGEWPRSGARGLEGRCPTRLSCRVVSCWRAFSPSVLLRLFLRRRS